MTFETKQEILDWYENQPRTLTDDFIRNIPWNSVKDHAFDRKFIPVLLYMRDVETLTDMYYRELRRTPTGRDPVISKFMERWGIEEVTHGEVLNRFLNEIGVETDDMWQTQVRRSVSTGYNVNAYIITMLTNLIGSKFTATHMTFGAIHEMTTAQSYRQLMDLADHPVLTTILKGIIREESAHTQFYWSVARLELRKNDIAKKLARFVIENFYYPVGQGSKPRAQTEYTIATLFGEGGGLDSLETTITQRVQQLPGFGDVTKITDTIGRICRENAPQLNSA
ncbi:MAG: acyl-ACP desaturase [Acidobacteriota bacterium]|nr:acyl-ACP desaturase [Acidobacteriota bacterium]